jgi:hypothetical protein
MAMGKEDCKPQPGSWANRQQRKNNKRFNKAFIKPKKVYKAPTAGLETELFRTGQPKDVADFKETVKKLAQYVGVNFKHGAALAQQAI